MTREKLAVANSHTVCISNASNEFNPQLPKNPVINSGRLRKLSISSAILSFCWLSKKSSAKNVSSWSVKKKRIAAIKKKTNNASFLNAIADHVNKLNNHIAKLENQIIDLGGSLEEECNDENM